MEKTNEREELNLDTRVTIRSIAGWPVGFARIADGVGDVNITAGGSTRLSRNEIIAQVQNGNKLFLGNDSTGNHATIYIEDEPTRVFLDFDSEDGSRKQEFFTDAKMKSLFDIKSQKSFESKFPTVVCTRAEKYAAIQAIKRMGLNDFNKIRFVENYTGYRVE